MDIDYTMFDLPQVLEMMFYPRTDATPPPKNARDHFVQVPDGVSVACRFYVEDPNLPTVLFFHGNGEVASDYDFIAPLYLERGINLFVADYRGYGLSGGTPTFSAMVSDAHKVFEQFLQAHAGRPSRLFVMGRSLGGYSALELACAYPQHLQGLIMESGFANVARLLRRLEDAGRGNLAPTSVPGASLAPLHQVEATHQKRLASLTMPVLVIHGEWDTIVPPSDALEFYEKAGSPRKRLVTIARAGHNDLLYVGLEEYFGAIQEFVRPSP